MSFETASNRDDRFTPQLIASLEFSNHLRGYNRDEVRAFLAKVAAHVSSLEEMLHLSRAEVESLKKEVRSQLQIGDIEASKIGEHAAEVVRIASDTARAIRIQAESQAEAIIQRAERSAKRIVEDAEAKAESLQLESSQSAEDALQRAKKQGDEFLNYADAQGTELIQKAKEEGRAIVYRAKELRSSYLNDARAKVDELMKEMSELEAARNSILTILNGAGRMIARVESSLDPQHLYLKSGADDENSSSNSNSISEVEVETYDGTAEPEIAIRGSEDPLLRTLDSVPFEDDEESISAVRDSALAGAEEEPAAEFAKEWSSGRNGQIDEKEEFSPEEAELQGTTAELSLDNEVGQTVDSLAYQAGAFGGGEIEEDQLRSSEPFEVEALFEEKPLEDGSSDSFMQTGEGEFSRLAEEDDFDADTLKSAEAIPSTFEAIIDEPIAISFEPRLLDDDGAGLEPSLADDGSVPPDLPYESSVESGSVHKELEFSRDVEQPSMAAQADLERLNRLEELFERIRVSRNSEELEANSVLSSGELAVPTGSKNEDFTDSTMQASPVSPSDLSTVGSSSEGASVVLGETEMALIVARDASVQPTLLQLSRRTKRLLQDDQNELLDALRKGGVEGAQFMTKELGARLEQRVEDLKDLLLPAVEAGYSSVRAVTTPEDAFAIAREVLEELLALLNQLSLTKVKGSLLVHEGGNESDQIGGISGIYRDLRSSRLDSIIEDAVVSAHSRGALAGSIGRRVRWIAHDKGNTCPDCEDNALNGETVSGEPFPTSHSAPPAHPGCRCLIMVERA